MVEADGFVVGDAKQRATVHNPYRGENFEKPDGMIVEICHLEGLRGTFTSFNCGLMN